MKKLCHRLVSQTCEQVMVNLEGKKRKQVKPEPWIKKKENSLGRESSNWYNNHRIIQIRCGRMDLRLRPPEATALESQGVQILQPASPASPAQLPAICLVPSIRFYAFQWCYHFPHPICIFYNCSGKCYWSVIYSRAVKPQIGTDFTRNFNSHNQAIEGFYYLRLHPTFPKLPLYGELFMLPTISPLWI